jgi:Carboxypeptidase regulatory-like domain/TonB dependent receptor-like, beta-barrel/TonB-dependent Receptor Plug Domain
MRQRRSRLTVWVSFGVLLGLSTAAYAQRTSGDISGTVTDGTGAVLPGASVSAVCADTSLTRTAVTDAQGGFRLSELPICVYHVTAELAGFRTVTRDAQVFANSVAKADFSLEVGVQSETITVQGVSPLIEFSDELNSRIDSKRVEEMPLSGRDFNSLLNMIPGVQHRPGGGFQGVNASGARTSSNNFMIDGISNNDRYYGDSVMNQTGVVGVPATLVPMDAIGDFTVQQTPSAEFGVKGGAAINVVMKSGGNTVHGTGYYFRHDDWTDSPNFFVKRAAEAAGTPSDPTPTKNQQYGGTFGGPIRKDKTFFFGYYEGQRLAVTSPYVVHVPTPTQIAQARARIAAAGMQVNPIGENLLKYYSTDPTGNINVNAPNVSNMNTFSVKIDHNLNANNLINGRVFYGKNFQSAPAGNGGEIIPPNGPIDMFNSVTDPTIASLAGLVWNSTLSNSTLLETRIGFNLFSQTIEPNNKIDPQSLGINTGPLDAEDLGVPGVTTPFGHIGGVGGYPITTKPTTTTQVSMALTQTRGSHTFKVGGAWDYAYNRSVRNQARTTLTANGRTSNDVDALVGLLLGRFENAARSFGQTERHMSQTSIGVFINDDWKVTSRLTLSGGVRYEVFSPVSERDNLATNFFPDKGLVQLGNGIDKLYNSDTNNFGPRAGLAWDVMGDGRTSVRAGYALTYDSAQIGVVHPGLFSTPTLGVFRVSFAQTPRFAPDSPQATCLDPNNSAAGGDYICLQPGVPVFGSSPTGAPPFNIFQVPDDFQLGRYHYFHATLQRQLGDNNSVTVSYVGSRGQGLVWRKETNAPPLGSPTTSPDLLRPYRSTFPQFRSIVEYTNDGASWYDSLQLSFRQNSWHGVNTQYNYTLSNCQDYNSGNRDAANAQAANPYDPSANKGPCDFDIRHNFNVGGSYEVPGLSQGGGPLQIGVVFSALSGRPFTPGVGTFDQSGQGTGVLRADCLAEPTYNWDLDYLFPDPTTNRSVITNAAQAFATPAAGKLGTCGRNSGRRAGFAALDLNILKEFRLRGNTRIQARWEIFNLTNRVNLGAFQSTSVRSGVFGQIGSTPDVDRGNAVIGSGGPRAMQWALKVLF